MTQTSPDQDSVYTPQTTRERLCRTDRKDDGTHSYLSTGCTHGHHDYCKSNTGANGDKAPAQCKFCAAPCICKCHQDEARQ